MEEPLTYDIRIDDLTREQVEALQELSKSKFDSKEAIFASIERITGRGPETGWYTQ